MYRLVVSPQNPLQLTREDLAAFLTSLEAIGPHLEVEYTPREQRGYAVTWWEVVHVFVPAAAVYVGGKLVEEIVSRFVDWARDRLRKEQSQKRPKYVAIYGADGKILKSVVVQPDESVVDRTSEDQ